MYVVCVCFESSYFTVRASEPFNGVCERECSAASIDSCKFWFECVCFSFSRECKRDRFHAISFTDSFLHEFRTYMIILATLTHTVIVVFFVMILIFLYMRSIARTTTGQ